MIINGEDYPLLAVFPHMMTVPDCIVTKKNKIGSGHGEAKFYIATKEDMYEFYGSRGFSAKCFVLKTDLIAYMNAVKVEYIKPSQNYYGKEELPTLWNERMEKVKTLEDVIFFTIYDQEQITGPRGYINSDDYGYKLIRELSLPMVSFIYAEKVGDNSRPLFYWRLFVDYQAMEERQGISLVLRYSGRNQDDSDIVAEQESISYQGEGSPRQGRVGQAEYRRKLLEQCPICPITRITDERLLIASHIKPWAVSTVEERVDPYNGYMLSPMIDKLFDQGFITFTDNKHIVLSEFISPNNWKSIGLRTDEYYQMLPMDAKRMEYLQFHRESVFKGRV